MHNIDVVSQEENTGVEEVTSTEDKTVTPEKSITKKSPNQNRKFLRLPLARVKHMMKQDPDVSIIGQDAVFLVAKATEMFIKMLGKKTSDQLGNTKRKTILRRDVDSVVAKIPNLCFLEGALD